MKKNHIIKMILSLYLLILFTLAGCERDNNAITIGIRDLNGNIESVDKEIAAPGDVVTFTGIGLDKVYKVMLNSENVPVSFTATTTELKVTIPSTAPLGEVITVNIFFSGKGLAQRAIAIQSPPTILKVTPSAAQPGTLIKVMGIELYKAVKVYLGDIEVTATIIDDKNITFIMPAGSTGGVIKLVSATGSETLSQPLIPGTEVMINDFDNTSGYYNGISANGNLKNPVYPLGEFPGNNYVNLSIIDAATSWGGNVDFYLKTLPTASNDKVTLSIDVKTSKNMDVNIMVQGPGNVYGLTKPITTAWQTIVIPFSEMGTGYGSSAPFGQVEVFNTLTAVKVQPPASSSNNNFGETISIDNIKFIITN